MRKANKKLLKKNGWDAAEKIAELIDLDVYTVITCGMPCVIHFMRTGITDCYKLFPQDKPDCNGCICDSQKWLGEDD